MFRRVREQQARLAQERIRLVQEAQARQAETARRDTMEGDLTFIGSTLVKVHGSEACAGRDTPCCIHHPSDHHMATWPMNWRGDTRVMERMCPHGIGHPDPDHMAYVTSVSEDLQWQGLHSCDGCCAA